MSHRVFVYWQPRPSTLGEQAAALWQTLRALSAHGGALAQWSAIALKTGNLIAIEGERECEQTLAARTIVWTTGDREQRSHQARLTTTSIPGAVNLEVTMGIQPLDLDPERGDAIFTPNRAMLTVDGHAHRMPVEQFADLLKAMAVGFDALFGFAGGRERPIPPGAIFSDGRPPVGWMTFLHQRYGALPALPEHTAIYPTQGGSIVVALADELYDERSAKHNQVIARVQEALDAASILVTPDRV